MDFSVSNGSIYNPNQHIIEDLSFILTMDKDDESNTTLYIVGEHDTVVNHYLPKINPMREVMHIICFTFDDNFINKEALSKTDQVKIVNYMRNYAYSSLTATIAQAIHTQDIDKLTTAFDKILNP